MNNEGEFVVHIEGKKGNLPLSPANFDISMLRDILIPVSELLKQDKGIESNTVLTGIEEGSVKGIFKTSKETAAKVSAVLLMLAQSPTLDQFDTNTGKAFEGFQSFAVKHDVKIGLSTSFSPQEVSITPESNLYRSTELWVDAEVYLYGKIVDAGGMTKTNLHMQTELGNLIIEATEDEIVSIKDNPIYKMYGVRASGKQNIKTGEIDKRSLHFIEIIDYSPSFDKSYIDAKIEQATPSWKGVDVDAFLHELREGGYA